MANIAGYPSAVVSGSPGKSGKIQGDGLPVTPFDPLQITAIIFWHDGQFGVSADGEARVSSWTDRSTPTNDLAQGTMGFQPLYDTSGATKFLKFDGSDDSMTTGAYDGGDKGQPNTMFMVFRKRTTPGVSLVAVDGLSISKRNAMFQSGSVWAMFSGTTRTFQTIDTSVHIFVLIFNSTVSMMLQDGVSQGTADTGMQVMDGLTIGGKFGDIGNIDVDFSESIMYNKTLTNVEINQVGNYLGTKYNITWSNFP